MSKRNISEIKRRKRAMLAASQRTSPKGFAGEELTKFKGGRPLIVEKKVATYL